MGRLKINEDANLSELEKYALWVLGTKLQAMELAEHEKMLLLNDFIAEYLEFDDVSGEPVGETSTLEAMIDFLLR